MVRAVVSLFDDAYSLKTVFVCIVPVVWIKEVNRNTHTHIKRKK